MTTIHDFSDGTRPIAGSEPLTLIAFLAARAARRHDEAVRLRALRATFARRIEETAADHLQRAERLFSDPSLTRAERARLLAHHRLMLRDAIETLRGERDATVEREYPRTALGRWLRASTDKSGDRKDFRHILKSSYADGGHAFDPVLLAIPRARRRREGAMTVYSVIDGRGDREIFRVLPDTNEVLMRVRDERSLEAAIVKAQHDFGPPLRFASNDPDFRARCEAIAQRRGLTVADWVGPSAQDVNHASDRADVRNEVRRAAEPTASPPRGPTIDLAAHQTLCEGLKQRLGIDYVAPLSPTSNLSLTGRVLGVDPHPGDPSTVVAAIETPNGAALVAVDRASIDGVPIDSIVGLRGNDGRWQIAVAHVETNEHSDHRAIADRLARGR